MNMTLSDDDIKAGLTYSRWLHRTAFDASRNNYRSAFGLPEVKGTVCLNEHGKSVYEQILRSVHEKRESGGVLLPAGERKAVTSALCSMKSSGRHAAVTMTKVEKFLSSGKRMIRGRATAPSVDRVGDVVEPRGGVYKLPLPLLWMHKHDHPIGWVREAEVRDDGIWIVAEIAEGVGKADETWSMLESGLVDSFSIGFRGLDWKELPRGAKRFTKWELLEVSVVVIPANPDAKIGQRNRGSVKLVTTSTAGGVKLSRPKPNVVRLR